MAAKTMALISSAKDQVRESRAKELTSNEVRPKILDEGFHDYHKLINNAKVEPPLFTLPGLHTPGAAPARSRQKRGGDRLEADAVEDTGESGSGTRPVQLSPPRD